MFKRKVKKVAGISIPATAKSFIKSKFFWLAIAWLANEIVKNYLNINIFGDLSVQVLSLVPEAYKVLAQNVLTFLSTTIVPALVVLLRAKTKAPITFTLKKQK